ncbi:MAG: hypothetical protein ACLT0Y_01035 [Christensenellales bacterium]
MKIDIVGEQTGTVSAPAGVQYVTNPKMVTKARAGKNPRQRKSGMCKRQRD